MEKYQGSFFKLFRFIKDIHIDCFRLELSSIEQALMERYQAGLSGSGEKRVFFYWFLKGFK